MAPFTAPVRDMEFALAQVVGLDRLAALEGRETATSELIGAVLGEAGKLCADVLAPLNAVGDREHSRLENGVVRTPTGFKDAYKTYAAGGWNGLPVEPEHGGQ